jgi:CheY-like chemotaxis protein
VSVAHSSVRSILIVDDDRELTYALGLRCQSLGLRVHIAYDVQQGLAILRKQPLNLVCLDINLPDGSGLEICEALATDPRTASIPVIVLTGRKDAETIRGCGELCAYYLHKSGDLWSRIAPVVFELVDIEPLSVKQ